MRTSMRGHAFNLLTESHLTSVSDISAEKAAKVERALVSLRSVCGKPSRHFQQQWESKSEILSTRFSLKIIYMENNLTDEGSLIFNF